MTKKRSRPTPASSVVRQEIPLRLIAASTNEYGDLLTRIARDLCHALGFSPIRLNVNRTGREVDIVGEHRLERRRFLCGECKSAADPVGGDEVNKFVGVLDAERRRA